MANIRNTKKAAKLLKDKRLAARRFRDRNRRFKALTKHRQKLKILKDVIALLENNKIEARTNNYLRVSDPKQSIEGDEQLHEVFERSRCTVCAIGGIFTASVLLRDDIKVSKFASPLELQFGRAKRFKMAKYLARWFDSGELGTIESAFEKRQLYPAVPKDKDAAIRFGYKYKTSRSRLLAICKNMLSNNGKFVPGEALKI